jgi:hypothetical protein
MLSEYRQRYGDLQTELQRDAYLFRTGRKSRSEGGAILRENSDLFEKTGDLKQALEETAAHRETERASLRRLIAFASEGWIAMRVRELSEEIARHASEARINWDEQTLNLVEAERRLAAEPDATRRGDLHARCADCIKRADDLRAERLERLRDAARSLQFDSLLAMHRALQCPAVEKLADAAARLLSETESRYVAALAALLPRELGLSMDDAREADLPRLHAFPRFDAFFSPERMPNLYRDLFGDLGFRTDQQSNVALEPATGMGGLVPAFCAPIRVPEEIRLVYGARGGQAGYREFLRAAGLTQHAAWTSATLYPEFRFGAGAVPLAWGLLFENLPLDPRWLMSVCGFVENAVFRHALAVFRLMAARRAAAHLLYECEVFAGGAGMNFAERMRDAVRVNFDETKRLPSLDAPFHAADALRACAFEAQLREHLKMKFGERWWASRKAGETLVDLWNTGQRHSIEELAALIGLGELNFDWLAGELLNGISI